MYNGRDMKMSRFYCSTISQETIVIDGEQFHHLVKVRRLGVGDEVELFDGSGGGAVAVITEINKAAARLKIQHRKTQRPRQGGRIIVAVSIAKGSRFDWLVSKCTELGADRIVPIVFERTVKLAKGAQAGERYNKLAIEAAKQCGRDFLPRIDEPCSLSECVENLKKEYPQIQLLFGSLEASAKSIMEFNTADSDVAAFVGPEGGLTDGEETVLLKNSALGVRLTETILRVETAAIAFAAVLAAKRDFGR